MSKVIQVDLGCGEKPREGTIGLDIHKYNKNIKVCNLGFELLPFADNSVQKFYAYDFLEHLSMNVYIDNKYYSPVIFLFNEIWRCLISGGEFESSTPVYPGQEVWQDPTHKSVWTMNTMQYFCGAFKPLPSAYGIKCNFEMVINKEINNHLFSVLKKN